MPTCIFMHASYVMVRTHRTFDVMENWSQAVKSNALLGTKEVDLFTHGGSIMQKGHKMHTPDG